ncbi:MAG: tetratricopeptide repeat protein [Planctomycetaceae bacterium]|nr:tetratricopeptide repeat protein [Planctomycetaceae bacterium]
MRSSYVCLVLGLILFTSPSTNAWAAEENAGAPDRILDYLTRRANERPDDGATWRLLGRAHLDRGQISDAQTALERAVELTSDSVAAWCDLGYAYSASGNNDQAKVCFQTTIDLEPTSEYAQKAEIELEKLAVKESSGSETQLAGYETRTFDGTEFLDRIDDTDPPRRQLWKDRLDARLDVGILYNSNVALAPLNRELYSGTRESFQFFAAPDLQLGLIDEGRWRTGPTFRGNFTLNDEEFQDFNLQSYRPGWFAEWFLSHGERVIVPRLAYEYTFDRFGGNTLGNRHSLLGSLGTFWDDVSATFIFYSLEQTNFQNDGVLPEVTSQDGWTNTLGLSHDILLPYAHFRLIRAGADLSRSDTKGTDYSYNGFSLFFESVFPMSQSVELTVGGSWGYRDYFDFEFDPSRNESVWRASTELRKRINENTSLAAVFNYNLFDSENPIFAAERYIGGVQMEWEY